MKTQREKKIEIALLKEKIERISGKKVTFKENRKLAKQNFLNKGLITQEEFDKLVEIDPTPQKKYVFWLAKQYKEEGKSFDVLKNIIEEFDVFVNKNKFKEKEADINFYKTFDQLQKAVDHLNQIGGMSLKELENDYDIIVDNKDLYIVSPNTHEASRKLGLTTFAHRCKGDTKDSTWCTTFKNDSHYNDYYLKNRVTFYYALVKGKELMNELKEAFPQRYKDLEKIAFAVFKNGRIETYDAADKQLNSELVEKVRKIIGI
jgi:hypothetical protein